MEGDPERRLPEAPVWFSYVENKPLEERFYAKKIEFEQARKREDLFVDPEPIMLFHGTSFDNTDGICRTNFNLDAMSRFAWGRGIYLSKYPITSLLYGEALVVCKVLLGRKQATAVNAYAADVSKTTASATAASKKTGGAPAPALGYVGRQLQEGYDSLEIKPNEKYQLPGKTMSHVAGAFVIRSVDQILPYCVISAEYPKSIQIGGMQSKSLQKKAAEVAKAERAK